MRKKLSFFYLMHTFLHYFICVSTFILCLIFTSKFINAQVTADFIIPDTVCVNEVFPILNTSVGGSTYYWSFCTGNLPSNIVGQNLGNMGALSNPTYISLAKDSNICYSFVTNHLNGTITRNIYGNSFSLTPTSVNLGNFGVLNGTLEGIQIKKDNSNNNWYGLIAGGQLNNVIFRLNFGSSLSNTPIASNLGNISSVLTYPHTIYTFQEGGNWYSFVGNYSNNTIARLSFGNSLANTPTGINIGNIGSLAGPVGLFPIMNGGLWHIFVVNRNDNTISRLDFGNSLTNTPTGVNLGNIASLNTPRSITIIPDCEQVFAFVVNESTNDIVKLTFPNGITSVPVGVSLGNIANFNFPHQISEVFRVNDTLYNLITNVTNNTISRISFPSCVNSSFPSSSLQTPPPISYDSVGVYNINLIVDEGLPTQDDICKQIVVVASPTIAVSSSSTICSGESVLLTASGANNYTWSPSTGLSATTGSSVFANPTQTTTYTVIGISSGCSDTANVIITVNPSPIVTITPSSTSICSGDSAILTATGGTGYLWSNGDGTPSINVTPSSTTTYTVTVSDGTCSSTDDITVIVNLIPIDSITGDTLVCVGTPVTLTASAGLSYNWSTTDTTQSITVIPANGTTYNVTVSNAGCSTTSSITINTTLPPTANAGNDTTINIGGSAQLLGNGGIHFSWSPSSTLSCSNCANPVAGPISTTTYILLVTDTDGCTDYDTVTVFVDSECGEVFVPNAFSPNKDGQNKLECVYGNCIQSMEFAIYDRWGENVFYTTDPKECWDGTYKGKLLNTVVFVYYLKTILYNGTEINKKGNINLFR